MSSLAPLFDTLDQWGPTAVAVFMILDGLRKIVRGEATEEHYYGNHREMGRPPDEVTTYFGWRAVALGALEIAAGIAVLIYVRN